MAFRGSLRYFFQPVVVASFVSIIATSLRAFNVGYNTHLYLISAACYTVMMYSETEQRNRILNGFYLLLALVAVYRWR